jgi:hypothetical protein
MIPLNYKALLLLLFLHNSAATELPNSKLTPGNVRIVTVTQLCTTSTSLVRNVTESTKNQVFANYKMKGNDRSTCNEGYEIDHLVSLELGGSNDITNLWPQSYCGENNAHKKDKLENELHKQVCSGKMTLEDAQKCIASDWEMCYIRIYHK